MNRIIAFLFPLLFVGCLLPLAAQQPLIALHNDGNATFFASLQEAYDAAVSGDTLYIPGGNFPGIGITKSLALIGVGHHPDSTLTTGATVIDGLNFHAGGDGSFVTGIYINGRIQVYEGILDVAITRCYIDKGFFYFGNGLNAGWKIYENWVGMENHYFWQPYNNCSIFIQPGTSLNNFLISNTVFKGRIIIPSVMNSVFFNNIFLENAYAAANYSVFRNNIFASNSVNNSTNSKWYYNLNAGVNGSSGTNIGSGNYLDDIPLESIFVNYAAGNSFYQNDFHVVNPAYIGNDGAPVGIYGGPYPWKEGSLPFNPHIQSMQVNSVTNPDGSIHISGAVKAQQN